jgi:hypothetical protein
MIHGMPRTIYRVTRALPVIAALLLSSALALGQNDDSNTKAEVDVNAVTKKLMGEGNALYVKRDFEGAYKKFLAAWQLRQHSAIASNLIETELKLGRFYEAARRLQVLLAALPVDDSAERTAFMGQLDECRRHLVSLHVSVNVNGATVKVDGNTVGNSPLVTEILVEPGWAKVNADLDGYKPLVEMVGPGAAGESKTVSLKLVPKAQQHPEALHSAPTTTIDSNAKGSVIRAKPIVLITGAALTITGAVVGAVYLSKRSSTDSESRKLREELSPKGCVSGQEDNVSQCEALHNSLVKYDRQTLVMTSMFIGSGVVAAATVLTYFLWPKGTTNTHTTGKTRVELIPWASVGTTGLQLTGAF